ncbi:MAG: V-type ATP synthase subunit E [Victivallales bacterium]|nr:V-type ATP synthase subunit E [Victivallales bacterium]
MEAQEKKLRDEILAEARQRAERIVARARREAESVRVRTTEANENRRQEALEECRRESALKKRNLVQSARGEGRNLWLRRREACIDGLLERVLKRVHELPAGSEERARSLSAVTAEALAVLLPAAEVKIFAAPADLPLITDEWLAACCPAGCGKPGFELFGDERISGGIRIESGDGMRSYDNSYEARMKRLHGDFRSMLAAVIPNDFEEP